VLELILGTLLAAGATYFVLRPILRPGLYPSSGAEPAGGEGEDPEDDLSPHAVALRALKEIEFDRATGKLSDADYHSLRTKYSAEAVVALRDGSGERGVGSGTGRTSPAPRSPLPAPVCPVDGPRPEGDAVFCSTCGRRLGTAPAYCVRCGSALDLEARYCNRCGARIAA
jgi:hypothetical protein